MTPLRVVIAGDYPEDPSSLTGGIQATLFYTLEKLAEYDDLELHVVTCEKGHTLAAKEPVTLQRGRLTVHYLPASRLPHTLTMLSVERLRVARWIQGLAPDLIHAHGQAAAYPHAALDLRCPTVITVHGMNRLEAELDPRGGKLKGWLRTAVWGYAEHRALRRATDLVVISPFVGHQIAALTRARLHDIANPVHDDFFQIDGPKVPARILFVGSIQARKGVRELIQAMAQVVQDVPSATLHLAGGFVAPCRDYQAEVQQMAHDLGLENHVRFLGGLSHQALLEEHRAASIFVLPSWLESSPVALAEAMAAGEPAVTTDIGGTEHLIRHGENGFRVPTGDAGALAASLTRLLHSPELRHRFGAESRSRAQGRFSQEACAAKHHALYQLLGA